jgi:serine/threonine-protein kinase
VCLFEMLTGEVPFTAESQVGVAMKHVRDPLPNIQKLRPEISAALCAVIEKATAKETRNRYQTVADMVGDLERALAIEAARAGGDVNGEATSILNALPPGTMDFAPPKRRRRRALVLVSVLLVALAGGAAYALLQDRGSKPVAKAPAAAPLRSAKVIGATDFDPYGGGNEHSDSVRNVFDGSTSTTWTTEQYDNAQLGKPGVGIYVWTSRPVTARRLEAITTTSGFAARVYGSNADSTPTSLAGWGKPIGRFKGDGSRVRAKLPGTRYSHYLIWITKLPPQGLVELGEVRVLY